MLIIVFPIVSHFINSIKNNNKNGRVVNIAGNYNAKSRKFNKNNGN